MYVVKDALKFTYALIGQHGTGGLLLNNTFLYAYNSALSYIYGFQGYLWSWMHTKDAFPNVTTDILRLQTRHPVHKVDRFWTSMYHEVEGTVTLCDCPDLDSDMVCAYECDPCVPECESLRLKQIQPNNRLCPGEYQIAGSSIPGMGGIDGTSVRVLLQKKVDTLWMSYYRGPKHAKKFDEIVPLPDSFIGVLGYVIAAHIIPQYGIMMQGQEVNRWNIANQQLESLKLADNRFPKDVRLSPDYPYEEPKSSYPSGYHVMNP